jgi:hypothetical protein
LGVCGCTAIALQQPQARPFALILVSPLRARPSLPGLAGEKRLCGLCHREWRQQRDRSRSGHRSDNT